MAKITRYTGNVQPPAVNAVGTERTIFGGITQADDLDSNLNADLLRGWGVVPVNGNPTKQDFNAMGFTLGQLIAYLHQVGVAEWDSAQEYNIGSYASVNGTLYESMSEPNIGNAPTTDDGTNWVQAQASYINGNAKLRDIAPVAGRRIIRKFHTIEGDGGGLDFRGITGAAPGTYVDNNGTIIVPTGGDGSAAWVADVDAMHTRYFGCLTTGLVGDETTNNIALANWLSAALAGNYEAVIDPGDYYYTTGLVANYTVIADKDGVSIRGSGSMRDCRLIFGGSGTALDASGTGTESGTIVTRYTLSHFSIYGNGNNLASKLMDCSRNYHVQLNHCDIGGIYTAGSYALDIRNVFNFHAIGCSIYCGTDTPQGRSAVIFGSTESAPAAGDDWSSSNILFENCLISRGTYYGIELDATAVGSTDTVTLFQTAINECGEGWVYMPDNAGSTADLLTTVSLRDCHFELAGIIDKSIPTIADKTGIYIENARSVKVDDCHFNTANVFGEFVDCRNVIIDGGYASINAAYTGLLTNKDGFKFSAPGVYSKVRVGPFSMDTSKITGVPYTVTSDINHYENFNAPDYSRRTWTPTLSFGTGSVTYTSSGWWSESNDRVFFDGVIEVSAIAAPTGLARITGLPKLSANLGTYIGAATVYWEVLDVNTAAPDIDIVGRILGNNDKIDLKAARDNVASGDIGAYFTATTKIFISGSYPVSV